VDVVYIGPNDLAASLGLGVGVGFGNSDPRLTEAIQHVCQTARARGVATGIHCADAADVNQRLAEGFQFCALASELRYLLAGLRADIAALHWHRSSSFERAEPGEGVAVQY
jgi:4-hydroxy-2-oxoheptanedioate aldolase